MSAHIAVGATRVRFIKTEYEHTAHTDTYGGGELRPHVRTNIRNI